MQTKLSNAVVHYRLFAKTGLLALILIFCMAHAWAQELPRLGLQAGHKGFVSSLAYSPNGKTLVSGSDDITLRLWDIDSGREIKILSGQ